MNKKRFQIGFICSVALVFLGVMIYFEDLNSMKIEIKSSPKIEIEQVYMIDINKASESDLMEIKGIGAVTAKNIVDFISQKGGIKLFEELDEIKGVGEKTINLLTTKFYIAEIE